MIIPNAIVYPRVQVAPLTAIQEAVTTGQLHPTWFGVVLPSPNSARVKVHLLGPQPSPTWKSEEPQPPYDNLWLPLPNGQWWARSFPIETLPEPELWAAINMAWLRITELGNKGVIVLRRWLHEFGPLEDGSYLVIGA